MEIVRSLQDIVLDLQDVSFKSIELLTLVGALLQELRRLKNNGRRGKGGLEEEGGGDK